MLTVMTMARKGRGLTQIDLANEVGITQAEISMIERGKVNPKEETLAKIASLLGTPADELLMDYTAWVVAQTTARNSMVEK